MLMLLAFHAAVAELAGALAFLPSGAMAIADRLPDARLIITHAMHWANEFDARLLGCPTIILDPH